MLTLNDGRSELWQWDTGRTLAVDADCTQVHFSNKVFGRSIDVDVANGVAIIPDILLQTDKELNVWAFVGTAENGYTKISKTFKVNRRNKPADYVFTPQEQILLKDAISIVETAKSASNDAIESAKQAADSSTQASKSADAAADSASAAEAAKQAAAQSAERATQAGIAASNAAEEAERSAGIATDAAGNSELNAENAHKSELAAQQSANNAAESQSAAAASAASAQRNAEQVAIDAKTAVDAKVAAAGSADAAAGSAVSAGNSASAAARSEQAAGASEGKAAESENAAKASEQAAAESAQAALESKTAAATSEVNAAASAKKAQDVSDSLPADYVTAVNEIDTLKQQVANITPDDSTIGEKPWSSKNIVDSLCQPFEESGNPVQVYPVENYPLDVKASWEPVQEGSGDPSPENIRPIKGRDSVRVTRCGENLFDVAQCIAATPDSAYGLTVTVDDTGLIRVFGTPNVNKDAPWAMFRILFTDQVILTKEYKAKWFVVKGVVDNLTIIQKDKSIVLQTPLSPNTPVDIQFRLMYYVGAEPITYTPYTGSTTDIALPETVYGGTLDLESGVVTVDRGITIADGTTNKFKSGTTWGLAWRTSPGIIKVYWDNTRIISSHFKGNLFSSNNTYEFIFTSPEKMTGLFDTVDDLNAYLVEQNAAGTPVTFVYRLATPYTIQITPQQIAALSGVNTLYTDADGVVVTGAEDPKHTITELKNAIISLGGNI